MTLKCINSGSSGNCYILTCNNEKLILDCGLPIKVIKQGLDFDLQGIQAVLITHCHKDHSLSVDDFKKNGLELSFLKTEFTPYKQFKNDFIPGLSMIDILMFNSPAEIKQMLNAYSLIKER